MVRKARRGLVAAVLFFVGIPILSAAQPESVSEAEARSWLRHLLPLPHEITIHRKVVLPPSGVSVRLRENATEIERQAAGLVGDLFQEKTGIAPGR